MAVSDKFRPTIVKRASKRLVDVTYLGDGCWVVIGNPKLGDEYERYEVTFHGSTLKYHCSCQGHVGGEYRHVCSHIIACMLHKEDGGYRIAVPRTEENSIELWDSTPTNDVCDSDAEVDLPLVNFDGALETMGSPVPCDVPGNVPLPEWVVEFRASQWTAIREILDAYDAGADVVVLDAPTGSGKTLIGEVVRRYMQTKGFKYGAYVCSSLTLQDQFLRDFPYAKVLKGRSNYPTQLQPFPEVTAADCTNTESVNSPDAFCYWCSKVPECGYNVARREALRSDFMVLNTAYFLTEGNYVGYTSGRDFVIVDECDTLEGELMNFVQFAVTQRQLDTLGISAPKKGSHKNTITTWFTNDLIPTIKEKVKSIPKDSSDVKEIRRRNSLTRLLQGAQIVSAQLEMDDSEMWIRDNDAGPMVLKPVKVDWAGQGYLWQHGKKWLCMSATVISVAEFCESLGLNVARVTMHGDTEVQTTLNVELVRHPMTFPVENRPIHVAGVANVTAKEKEAAYPRLATAIDRIGELHPNERILVHTVSYELTRFLLDNSEVGRKRGLAYFNTIEREGIIHDYLHTEGSVLFAPSLGRGADFKDDSCRVIVVAKMPFLYLGDRQVSSRLHMNGGQIWYNVQTVRTLVQMTGRGVRSADDWAVTYILDRQFMDNVMKRSKNLLPEWWREALNMGFRVRDLM